jgi:penicillin-binding protein 1A
MTLVIRIFRFLLATGFALLAAGLILLAAAYFYIAPQLPPIDRLKDVQLQVPLRIYARDGELIAEFGEQRRKPLHYRELPEVVIDAILATEDDRFFEHPGVDYQGLLRAAVELVRTGQKLQGGSTITMQVARNFFLTNEKTYLRKLTEIFLALKIERHLSKQEILELYLNKIYFGHRAYGIAAAAEVYYGLPIQELSVAQVAMIAGLPKAPSANNPVSNPARALVRRNYILGRMYVLGAIDSAVYSAAVEEPDNASLHNATPEVSAPYVAEMVRSYMVDQYGDEAYTGGYRVITTLSGVRQRAASDAVRTTLLEYERRHGYRGVEGHVQLPDQHGEADYSALLAGHGSVGGLRAALVLELGEQSARIYIGGIGQFNLDWQALSWARKYITVNQRGPELKSAKELLAPGDLIRVQSLPDGGWMLAQIPLVSGALVSLAPSDGALQALVGGFDFDTSKFNRALQARRQPGSSFKPFVYSAALAKGYTLASVFNDAPVVFDDPSLETTWRPENYSGKFYGPTRMREALTHSRNLVSIRLIQAIGPGYAADYAERFGFRVDQLPRNLSLALGSGAATPMEMARAYSVWANGGFLIEPYFISEIRDADGAVVFSASPAVACLECKDVSAVEVGAGDIASESADMFTVDKDAQVEPGVQMEHKYASRVVDYDNVYLMTSMLQDVIKRGTARRALALGRQDLSGKTGTTNDQRDAWFCGFNSQLVTTVWVGFDQMTQLGAGETGGKAALPMWLGYMRVALQGVPESTLPQPPGLVTVRIDAKTGLRLPSGQAGGLFELFRPESAPQHYSEQQSGSTSETQGQGANEPLF